MSHGKVITSLVVNNILDRSFHDGLPVTQKDIQKILFDMEDSYRKETGDKMFIESPVLYNGAYIFYSVSDYYLDYGNNVHIESYFKNALGKSLLYKDFSSIDVECKVALERSWNNFKDENKTD